MNWLAFSLGAVALSSLNNHLDKYILGKYVRHGESVGGYVALSSVIGALFLPLFLLLGSNLFLISRSSAAFLVLNGVLYACSLLPYFYALRRDEASVVAPLFQFVPFFGFCLGALFLHELIGPTQLLLLLMIPLGSFLLTLRDEGGARGHFKHEIVLLMMLSSFLIAANGFFFKYMALQEPFWTTVFWEYLGFVATGLSFLALIPRHRRAFRSFFEQNGVPFFGLSVLREAATLAAKLMVNFATLGAPLVLVWTVVDGFFAVGVFLFGILFTVLAPRFAREKITGAELIRKFTAIALMTAGALFLK